MALPHAEPAEIVDLRPLGTAIPGAKTAAIVKARQFEAIRLVVLAGQEIPFHQVPGEITLHCLEGSVRLGLSQSEVTLTAGDWLYLDGGEPHALTGIEDASLLLTIILDQKR